MEDNKEKQENNSGLKDEWNKVKQKSEEYYHKAADEAEGAWDEAKGMVSGEDNNKRKKKGSK
ncbi:MAG: hypothetical protein BWY68_00731 [bacterium ADurb.Bin400]|nr:MAG: hypothetical protein BWY68_00731 [bacterium ADurb.Bin400]